MQTKSPGASGVVFRLLLLTAIALLAATSLHLWLRLGKKHAHVPSKAPSVRVHAVTAAGGESNHSGVALVASTDEAASVRHETGEPPGVTGEAAREQLRQTGQYESLAAAFHAARYAVEKIDPAGPHSRGAEYFAANPGQQLRAWFSKDGIELASGGGRRAGPGTGFQRFQPASPDTSTSKETAASAQDGSLSHEPAESIHAAPEPWSLAMRLRSTGRAGALAQVSPDEVRAEGSRVEMTDPAAGITQWFENRKDGVEQGFTITHPPAAGAGELEVRLAVEGTLRFRE